MDELESLNQKIANGSRSAVIMKLRLKDDQAAFERMAHCRFSTREGQEQFLSVCDDIDEILSDNISYAKAFSEFCERRIVKNDFSQGTLNLFTAVIRDFMDLLQIQEQRRDKDSAPSFGWEYRTVEKTPLFATVLAIEPQKDDEKPHNEMFAHYMQRSAVTKELSRSMATNGLSTMDFTKRNIFFPQNDLATESLLGTDDDIRGILQTDKDALNKKYDGWSPFHFAIFNPKPEAAITILSENGCLYEDSDSGMSPLDLCQTLYRSYQGDFNNVTSLLEALELKCRHGISVHNQRRETSGL